MLTDNPLSPKIDQHKLSLHDINTSRKSSMMPPPPPPLWSEINLWLKCHKRNVMKYIYLEKAKGVC